MSPLETGVYVQQILSKMSPRDTYIFECMAIGYTQKEIAKILGISNQRVYQLVTRVRHRLREE
jgi:RNA polymerase sigma factor (sigma-70 family)